MFLDLWYCDGALGLLSLDCARFFPLSRSMSWNAEFTSSAGAGDGCVAACCIAAASASGRQEVAKRSAPFHALVLRRKLNGPRPRVRAEGHGHCHRIVAIWREPVAAPLPTRMPPFGGLCVFCVRGCLGELGGEFCVCAGLGDFGTRRISPLSGTDSEAGKVDVAFEGAAVARS